MKKHLSWFLAAAFVAAFALPAAAGEGHKCAQDVQACLNYMASAKDKGWLGVEMEKGKDGSHIVAKVMEGSPAAKAGLQAGDVIVAVDGVQASDEKAAQKAMKSWKAGSKVALTVHRKGAEKQIAATLGPMPENVFAQMVGAHMIADHMAATTADASETKDAKN